MWPQITAGIAVNSQPHVNERIAKTGLQIAMGAMRATGCKTGDGVVVVFVSYLAVVMNVKRRSKEAPRAIGGVYLFVRSRSPTLWAPVYLARSHG